MFIRNAHGYFFKFQLIQRSAVKMVKEVLSKFAACKNHIKTLNRQIKDEECIKIWFEQLCTLLASSLYKLADYIRKDNDAFDKAAKDAILMYLTQLTSSLGLLIQIFIRESSNNLTITEARDCVRKQLFWCLDGLEEVINHNKYYEDSSGSFMKWMDTVLDELDEINLDNPLIGNVAIYRKARNTAEEVLCHAMSIAQVALSEDCKIIKGSSQAVLDSFDSLNKELLRPVLNKPMCNLFVDSCNEKLCSLERRVNEAVLKLCLKLFVNYVEPLNQLHTYCLNNNDEEKLDMLIADFDTHVDQIMQVGLFAIACTTNSKYSVKMKSCLASLEALEVEMVPAFNSLLKDRTKHNRNLSHLLENYWFHQANTLKKIIFLIIDPYAFAKVTYEEIEERCNNIVDAMKKNSYIIDNGKINEILNMGLVLEEMLITCIADIPTLDTPHIRGNLDNFKDVLYEVKAASSLLSKTKSNSARESSLRIIKRLKILLSVHKKLLLGLADDYESQDDDERDKETNNCNHEQSPTLDHLMVRGKQLIKDRSILHKTPSNISARNINISTGQRMPHIKYNGKIKPIPLLKLVHLRNMNYFNNSLLRREQSNITDIDLQVTDILDELSSLGKSFK